MHEQDGNFKYHVSWQISIPLFIYKIQIHDCIYKSLTITHKKRCGHIQYKPIYLADKCEIETVALDAEDELDVDVSPLTLLIESIKVGLVGSISGEFLDNNNTTTSDIVGLEATADCVHRSAISIILFTSSGIYSSWSNDPSTNLITFSFSYSFHAYIVNGRNQMYVLI